MSNFGRDLMFLGALIAMIGAGLVWGPRLPWLGRLPGDFYFKKGSFTFFFPLATGLLISLTVTILLRLFGRK